MPATDADIVAYFGEPPEGLDLEEDNVWRSYVGLIILICVAILSVVLRYVARFLQKAGLKADDYLMILAVVCLGSAHESWFGLGMNERFLALCYTDDSLDARLSPSELVSWSK